jgi:hypothetical protein
MSAKKQMNLSAGKGGRSAGNNSQSSSNAQKRPPSNYNYDEAVLKVQEWNEALKCEFSVFLRDRNSLMICSPESSTEAQWSYRRC